MIPYKRLDRVLVHKGKITTVYTDKVQLPDGQMADWDYIAHKGAAAFVGETEDGKIAMVKQYRNALNRYTLEIPAGGINKGESFEQAAVRELNEETGYRVKNVSHLIDVFTTVAFCDEKIGIYCGDIELEGAQKLDEDEYVEILFYSLEELENMILKGGIQDSKTVSGILAYSKWKQNSIS